MILYYGYRGKNRTLGGMQAHLLSIYFINNESSISLQVHHHGKAVAPNSPHRTRRRNAGVGAEEDNPPLKKVKLSEYEGGVVLKDGRRGKIRCDRYVRTSLAFEIRLNRQHLPSGGVFAGGYFTPTGASYTIDLSI
jgi:hypothetical protein